MLAVPAAVCTADDFFEKQVRPVFVERCQACHGSQTKMGGLDLSSAAGFAAGAAGQPLVSSENPADSLLLQVASYGGKIKMPPTGKLSDEELSTLRQWAEAGGNWPGAESAVRTTKGITAADREHWAFQPVLDPAPPEVKDRGWVRNPVDRFVLARLEAARLAPAAPAEKLKLLRRVTYDLIGLPPTPAEIAEFEADSSPEAFDRVVERLLASSQYGERWGRHWLDVARYAESTGMDEDHGYPYAWRYRDYVVDAFNSDLPYDRFVIEQVAGDLLPPSSGERVNSRGIVATGLLALGPKPLAQQDRVQMIYDVVDEQIDVVSKAFLGLTVTCARCHDHKFDPILQTDYYSMAAIFANTKAFRNLGRPGSVSYLHYSPLEPERYEAYQSHRERAWRKRLEMEEALAADLAGRQRELGERMADYLTAAFESTRQGESANERTLDSDILQRWMELLGSSTSEHWQAWRDATPATITDVAKEYQDEYLAAQSSWRESLTAWRDRFRREAEFDRNLPGRPRVNSTEFPVYAEAALDGGPFDVPEAAPVAELRAEWKRLEDSQPESGPMASAVVDLTEPLEQHVFLRGDHHNKGELVPRRFPVVLAGEDQPAVETTSGRLELARWIASPDHPLTARVMVNRIWQGHFGEGLVRSSNNWGRTGETPTHPELLDWLASRFVESGWSVKAMHRLILGSNAYRMSVAARAGVAEADPENSLLSRFNLQRLSVEAMRDSMLAVSGDLDLALGGNLMADQPAKERPNIDPDDTARRTLYVPVRRGSVLTLLSTFDFGDATTPGEGRQSTNVAPQALFVRNSQFVRDRAAALSELVLAASTAESDRLTDAYLRVLGRRPTADEADAASTYMARMRERLDSADSAAAAWASFCHVLLSSNEFLYLE